jgi:formylglycine-generating enzyme required for sulfatase activity
VNALTEWYNYHNRTDLTCVYTTDSQFENPIRISTTDTAVSLDSGTQDKPYINPNADGFRLPGLREWEFAARYKGDFNGDGDILDAGEYYPGNYASGASAGSYNVSASKQVAWFDKNALSSEWEPPFASVEGTQTVGTAFNNSGQGGGEVETGNSNALGIFDMSGNVSELTINVSSTNPLLRYHRGGGWSSSASDLQVANKTTCNPYDISTSMGLRIARTH